MQLLLLCSMMAVMIQQFAQAQLPIPLPDLPIPLPALPALPALPLLPAVTVCPAGYFSDLASCYPCARGSTSMAGVTCVVCPPGTYAPGPGSASCFFCPAGYNSAPAGEMCYLQSTCPGAKGSKKGGKRSLREETEIEMEEESESMFSFWSFKHALTKCLFYENSTWMNTTKYLITFM